MAVWDGDSEAFVVHRRFRSFERLHVRVAAIRARGVKLPPKRVLFHTLDEDFVRLRRDHLNRCASGLLLPAGVLLLRFRISAIGMCRAFIAKGKSGCVWAPP